MFRRRKGLSVFARAKQLFWPAKGWRRAGTYTYHRLRRLPGTPYSIAAGFACGAAMSFTPYIGFHFVGAVLVAWIIGGNLMASAIGTVVGNPWTFPFIWVGIYRVGCWMIGCEPGDALSETLTLTYIFDHPRAILLPMSVGALPVVIVVWVAFYAVVWRIVFDYQSLRDRRRARRRGPRGRDEPKAIGEPAGKEGK